MVMSAKLDTARAEAAYSKASTNANFKQVQNCRNEVLRLYGLKDKYVRQQGDEPIPTVNEVRAFPEIKSRRKALMDKYGVLGPENEIIVENIMSLVERQEIMRHDADADTKELMSIDARISANIEHLRKSLPTKDAGREKAVTDRTVAILEIMEAELRNDAVKLRRILEAVADAGYITAPGGRVGRTAKRSR